MKCKDPSCAYCKGRGQYSHHYHIRLPDGLIFALGRHHRNVAGHIRDLIERDLHETILRENAAKRGKK